MDNSLFTVILSLIKDPLLLVSPQNQVFFASHNFMAILEENGLRGSKDQLFQEVTSLLNSADCDAKILNFAKRTYSFNEELLTLNAHEKIFFQTDCVSAKLLILKPDRGTSFNESLSVILHDLKNPLGAIAGYTDSILESKDIVLLNEKQREIITRIRGASSRTIELLKNFQSLSQLEKQETIQDASSDLNLITKDIIEHTFRDHVSDPSIKMALQSDISPVRIDKFSLERIIANLYSNALKYTPAGGLITVSSFQTGNKVYLEVKNSPALIPKEETIKIFEKYKRGSNSTGSSGSGLGLFIVSEILKMYKSGIEVSSDQENGTCFRVVLNCESFS